MTRMGYRSFLGSLLIVLAVAGCAVPSIHRAREPAAGAFLPAADRAVEDRVLALDPERVTPADVRDTLANGPTPRVMLLHGGIYPVHLSMESFGNFLVEMGYPEGRIRDPIDGSWSHSPYEDAERLAGIVAWYYEKEGMPPLVIGHSQGGMQAVKILHVLNGEYGAAVPVWNPVTDFAEDRTSIVDPLTGRTRPVVGGVRVAYASAVGAGGAAFLLPNQWTLLGKLHTIPDTVEEFTGYTIDFDMWAWNVPGDTVRKFQGAGKVRVRNVTLDGGNSHVTIPVTADLPVNPAARGWIDAYVPGSKVHPPPNAGDNILWAADVWYSVKKYWVIEAQRLIRAQRATARPTVAGKLE
jgi:hypothetical protein